MKLTLPIILVCAVFLGCSSKEKQQVVKKPEVKIDTQKRDKLFKELDESFK
jgi:PBP1b-binding outer membrane lipoprotein LpoB